MAKSPLRASEARADAIDSTLIAKTLLELGGSAHVTVLFRKLQPKLSPQLGAQAPSLADLVETLRAHQSPVSHQINPETLFYQPFGDSSYRWCVCARAKI